MSLMRRIPTLDPDLCRLTINLGRKGREGGFHLCLSLPLALCARVWVYMYIYIYMCTYMYVNIYIYIYAHTYTCVCVYVCLICMHILYTHNISLCVHEFMYVVCRQSMNPCFLQRQEEPGREVGG